MKKYSLILFVMICVVTSCRRSADGMSFLPVSSGTPYEMLVVMDKAMYERPVGVALKQVLTSSVPGLPQREPNFRISTVPMSKFDGTFKIFRNIIVPNINPSMYTQTKLKFIRDLNSTPQMILSINSPSEDDLTNYLLTHSEQIVEFFVRAELNRTIKFLEKSHEGHVQTAVKEMFDCDVWVPEELSSMKKGENFLWASTPNTNQLNFCMYSYPYKSSKIFTADYFVKKRDSVMAKNIPGAREGMHMATQYFQGNYLMDTKNIVVRHEYAQEVRGLWEITNDNMGGPYISHVRVDTVNQRVIVAEGFVYMPNEPKKRDLIRKMEASLYTLQLPKGEKAAELPTEGVEQESNDAVDSKLKKSNK